MTQGTQGQCCDSRERWDGERQEGDQGGGDTCIAKAELC